MEDVDDAHASVRNALQSIASIEAGSFNQTERDHYYSALDDLQGLDSALAERSGFDALELAKDVNHGRGGDA